MSLLGADGAFQDLIGQNASSMSIDVDELIVQDSVKLDYANPNKNLITDANKKVITVDQDTFTNTDGNVTITQTDRNFDINLNTFSANKNIVSGASGELTTENKDSFVDVPNQTTWTEGAGRVFTATLPQDIGTTSDVKFNTIETNSVKTDKLVGNNEQSELIYEDDVVQKYFYPTVTSGEFNLGKSSNKFDRVYTEKLNTYVLVGDTYVSPAINNSGNLGNALFTWNDAHINNINTTNINAIGSTINFNDDVSATNITATDITATDITATDLKVNDSFNTLDDFKIYQTGSNPSITQTKFLLGAHGTISTTTNTDDTFTSSTTSIGIAGAIGATDLVLSSNPLTSFTATNEFEIINWDTPLILGFIENTYVPGQSISGKNPKVFLTIGSGNDSLSYVNSLGTSNTTSLTTSSTIGTTGYKYTFDIDNNKNLTIDKYTPATTTYETFTLGTPVPTSTEGRLSDVTVSGNTYTIALQSSLSSTTSRYGMRSKDGFRPTDYANVEFIFDIKRFYYANIYVGFCKKTTNLSTSSDKNNTGNSNDGFKVISLANSPDSYIERNPGSGGVSTGFDIAYTTSNIDKNPKPAYKFNVSTNGNFTIQYRSSPTSSWQNTSITNNIDPNTEWCAMIWDNSPQGSKMIVEFTGTKTTPAVTQQIFNSATIPTPFTLDNDSYRLFVSDNNSFATQYEVVIDGTINNPGTLVTKTEIPYLTADKNLILDSNNLLQVEDKDTITGTTNQININQVGRAFTLSAPQDLHTSANFQVATLNTGQGNNQLYSMDQNVRTTDDVAFNTIGASTYTGDVKTFAIESTATPSSYINLTSTNINLGLGSVGNRVFTIDSNGLTPYVNNTYDLGSNLNIFRQLYVNQVQVSAGSETNPAIFSETEGIFFNDSPKRINFCLDNTESIRITTDAIRSVVDNTYDLGFNGVDFKTLYIKNIENQTKLVLNQLNAWDVVYLDANKEVKGINLPSEHLLVGNANAAPSTRLIGEAYELHQNQVGTKFDPVKTSSTITILANGLGIHMNNTGVHRAMCINGITVPNANYTGVETRFGFELLEYANNPNLCFGFGIDSLPLDTTVDATNIGSYSLNIQNGKVHEDGSNTATISGFSYAIGDIFEFRIKTNNQFVIYQNGQEIYSSTGSITNGTYYPQVFDGNTDTTEFRVLLRPSYRGGQIDTIRVNTDYLTVNSFSYVEGISWSTNLSGRALTLTGNGTPDQIDFILTTSGNDFTQSANGALRYDGEEPKSFNVSYTVSAKPEASAIFTNPQVFSTHIDKGAVSLFNSRCVQAFYYQSGNQVSTATFTSSVTVSLSKNNTISLYLTNHSDSNNAVVPSVKISIIEIPK